MISVENVLYHELVGLKIKILSSTQNNMNDLLGNIIFETKNMLMIRTSKGIKNIPKLTIKKCAVYFPSNACFISGNNMIGRPEDRILKIRR